MTGKTASNNENEIIAIVFSCFQYRFQPVVPAAPSVSNLFPSLQLLVPNTTLEQEQHTFYSTVGNQNAGSYYSSMTSKFNIKNETEASS